MDYSIRQLAGAMVAQLSELQGGDQFDHLLNCPEPGLREEALHLYLKINELKSSLESI